MNEKKLLEALKHPFIVNMHFAFQDKENLYLIMDYLGGGDLRYYFIKRKKFNEIETKFILACLLLGLEYIHTKNILHRDIKPENLVFDERGYLKVTDFGISRIWSPKNDQDTSGTPGYMAPEVMLKNGHGIACDMFATGVIGYECILGMRPYVGENRKEIREMIINKQAKINESEKLKDWDKNAFDLVNSLLMRKTNMRLGNDKPGIARNHPFFKGFNWEELINGTMRSPFEGVKYDENMSGDRNPTNEDSGEEKNAFYRNAQVQKLFSDYFYDKDKMKVGKEESPKENKTDDANANMQDPGSIGTTKFTTVISHSK